MATSALERDGAATSDASTPVAASVPLERCGEAPASTGHPCPRGINGCECELVEVTGVPPCELSCQGVTTGPAPMYRTRGYTFLFELGHGAPRAMGRIPTYDGPLDAPTEEDARAAGRVLHQDRGAAAPTIEVRSAACAGDDAPATLARCAVLERYRYDGRRFVRISSP